MNLIEAKSWADEMDVQVTVCDIDGVIVYMNNASVNNFAKRGGEQLIGTSLFDCHNEQSICQIKQLLKKPQVMVFEVETNGRRKLIRETPWFEHGQHKGIIEIGIFLD